MAFLVERLRPAAVRQRALGAATDVRTLRRGLLGGAAAAGVGLLSVALPMLLLWIVTPYVEQGPGGVVHLAACVWLLAHGAELLRPASYGAVGYGGPGVPLGITPLLVSVLVLVPLYRAAVRAGSPPPVLDENGEARGDDEDQQHDNDDGDHRDGRDDSDGPDGPAPSRPWSALLGLAAGYLLVAAVAVAAASTGSLSVASPLAAFGWTALVSLPVAALGVRSGAGPAGWGAVRRPGWLRRPSWLRTPDWLAGRLPERVPDRLAGWLGRLPGRGRLAALPSVLWAPGGAAVTVRASLAGGAALLGVGSLVLVASLLLHFGAAGAMAAQTSADLAGRLALLLLCAVVLPNAAVWAAAYATGPGFFLGGWLGPLGPLGATAPAALTAPALTTPAFPLLSALPSPERTLLGLLALVLPLVVGAVVALIVGRAATTGAQASSDPARWGLTATVGVALAAPCGTGLLAALCAYASGGALGIAALAQVGPSPWRTGLAALDWTVATGVPGAVLLRWWISRSASGSTPGARDSRWYRIGCKPSW